MFAKKMVVYQKNGELIFIAGQKVAGISQSTVNAKSDAFQSFKNY